MGVQSGQDAASRRCDFVLLVGDGSSLRRAARDLLDTVGLPVLIAESGREALQLLHTGFRPRVLLLDVELSTFDDLWDFRQVQLSDGRLNKIPVIVLSEELSPASVRSQFREVNLVRKPIRPAALLEAIRRCLQPACSDREQRA
jgi:CheY-like chemotaxis protein